MLQPPAMAMGPDMSGWTTHTIQLSETKLSFRVPGRPSRDFPRVPVIPSVNLEQDVDPRARQFIRVFGEHWDYEPWLFPGQYGTLGMNVFVVARPDSFPHDLMNVSSLQELQTLELAAFITHNEEVMKKGHRESVVVLPQAKDFQRRTLSDREWLVFSLGGAKDTTKYVVPLTSHHYLEISFSFIKGLRAHEQPEWRAEAQAVTEQIMASIQLRKAE